MIIKLRGYDYSSKVAIKHIEYFQIDFASVPSFYSGAFVKNFPRVLKFD